MTSMETVEQIEKDWLNNPRWAGLERTYSAEDVIRLRNSIQIEHTLARVGAQRLWQLLNADKNGYVSALGAQTGNQAVQMIQAGLESIYVSGWQVAADTNAATETYPDQSLYPADSVPKLVQRINNALLRADQIARLNNENQDIYWLAPMVADAESGFGGSLNSYEIMKAMISAGVAGVHFEDQLSSAKKCGHMGGKVLVPTREFVQKLIAARLAADVMGVPTILMARTDADAAELLTSDIDPNDKPFITGERTSEGFYRIKGGLEAAVSRGLAYAPYVDMLWCETSVPDLEQAEAFAAGIHNKFPGELLAYNCSPSFNWKLNLDDQTIAKFQKELGRMGYRYQFVTLAGFHSLNTGMFELAHRFSDNGMTAYCELQEKEFALQDQLGFGAVKHQRFVGAGYFDEIQSIISGGRSSTAALVGSTEEGQFKEGAEVQSAAMGTG